MPEPISELGLFLKSVFLRWINLFGGAGLVFFGFCYGQILGKEPPVNGWWIFFSCLAIAVFLAWRDEHKKAQRLRPRLQVSIDQSRSIVNGVWNDGRDFVTFLRLVVSSLTASRIEDAKGYLVSIQRDSKILWDSQEVPLTFAPGENADALSKTIEDGGKYPLDVLIVRHGDNEVFMGTPGRTWPHFTSLDEIFSEKGEYILTLRVSAKDCPSILARMKFLWTKNADNCGIDLMPVS
jgi:hypothetical protein